MKKAERGGMKAWKERGSRAGMGRRKEFSIKRRRRGGDGIMGRKTGT